MSAIESALENYEHGFDEVTDDADFSNIDIDKEDEEAEEGEEGGISQPASFPEQSANTEVRFFFDSTMGKQPIVSNYLAVKSMSETDWSKGIGVGSYGFFMDKKLLPKQLMLDIIAYVKAKPKAKSKKFAGPDAFPTHVESSTRIYIARYYGLHIFKEKLTRLPSIVTTLSKGHPLRDTIAFSGTLLPTQVKIAKAYMDNIKKMETAADSTSFVGAGGIISVPCGVGKTVTAIKLIHELGRKAIIVLHMDFLSEQWWEEFKRFLPGISIGLINGKVCDVANKDVLLVMVQSIMRKNGQVSPNSQQALDTLYKVLPEYGTLVVDECHHMGAKVFSTVVQRLSCFYTLGLSATPHRDDGLIHLCTAYLGPLVYEMTNRADKTVRVFQVPVHGSFNYMTTRLPANANAGAIMMEMIKAPNRNELIVMLAEYLVKEQKKQTIIISRFCKNNCKHLHELKDMFDKKGIQSGLFIGGMKQSERDKSKDCQVILGTFDMTSEALNIPTLKALILASSMKSRRIITQALGRIVRENQVPGQLDLPIAFDLCDHDHGLMINQARERRTVYKILNYRHVVTPAVHLNKFNPDYINKTLLDTVRQAILK